MLLSAGTDTTANSLCWTIWFLANNPSVQGSARSQICDYFSKVDFKDKDPVEVIIKYHLFLPSLLLSSSFSLPTRVGFLSQVLNDALLSASFVDVIDAIFKESIRLKSPTPLLAFDPNKDDITLDGLGTSLSKSAQIIILTRLISVSERYEFDWS